MNSLYLKENISEQPTCGCLVALARASKFFKKKLTSQSISRLNKVLDSRNEFEHRSFFITDIESEIHHIATAYKIINDIYVLEFHDTNLISDCKKYFENDTVDIFDQVVRESSEEFKALVSEVNSMKANGVLFVECKECHYPFAKLNDSEDQYECLWCKDVRVLKQCSFLGCKNSFWDYSRNTNTMCEQHKYAAIAESLIKNSPAASIFNSGLNASALINMDTSLLANMTSYYIPSDLITAASKAVEGIYSPWLTMSQLAGIQRPSIENENSKDHPSTAEKKDFKKK